MDLPTLMQLFSVFLAAVTLAFGFVKWREAATNSRIDDIKAGLQKQIDDIEVHYARRSEFEQSLRSVEGMLKDMKTEQHRMASRMDDLIKWIIDNPRKS